MKTIIRLGNGRCEGECTTISNSMTLVATTADALAAGLNLAYAAGTDIAWVAAGVFGPEASATVYATELAYYQVFMYVPNAISSASGLAWTANGFVTGETFLEVESNGDQLTVSGSIAQDTIVAGATNYLGWVWVKEPNAAAVLDTFVLAYDVLRLPDAQLYLPTLLQPSFRFTVDLPKKR